METIKKILGKVYLLKLQTYYNKVNEHLVSLRKETSFKYYNPAYRVEVTKTACKLHLNNAMACKS
jgi:hypothetical protein